MCSANRHVRFAPNSDHESGFPQTVMSASLPKADMCSAIWDVRFVPIADISQVDIYRASQTVYLTRLQGMVIHNRHPFFDGNTFSKFFALRPGY